MSDTMTTTQAFMVLSTEVLPKLINRIVALEQKSGGESSIDTDAILKELNVKNQQLVNEAREHMIMQLDDINRRLDAVERALEEKPKKRTSKKKAQPEPEPVLDHVPDEPPVILEDAAESVQDTAPVAEPEPVQVPEAEPEKTEQESKEELYRQVRAFAGVGVPNEVIANNLGITVAEVKDIVG